MTITATKTIKTRMTDLVGSMITLDSDMLAMIQKGHFSGASFYGDQTGTGGHSDFMEGLGSISNFSGFSSILSQRTVAEKDPDNPEFVLTTDEYNAIVKRAQQIASYGNVPEDVVEDFLFMLVSVDNKEDLTTIANGVQLTELADEGNIRNVSAILNIPGLEKIAYMASALSALLKAFDKHGNAESNALDGLDDIGSIIGSLGSLLGGFGAGAEQFSYIINTPSPTRALGSLMSELVTGKRIPMSVIAKNPQLQSPSFIGKTMFGESPMALSNIDIKSLFAKKIGVFPKPSNGGATTTFGVTNFGSFGSMMNVDQFVSRIMFNSSNIDSGTDKYDEKENVLSVVKDIVGVQETDNVETNRADNVIPMMLGLSGGMSGLGQAPFSIDTFKQSWITSMSAKNSLQTTAPQILDALKAFA